MDRRLSVHSDSSVEPMDISAKTTASSDANLSSLAPTAKSDSYDEHTRHHHHHHHRRSTDNDNDEHEDEDEDGRRSTAYKHTDGPVVRRENLRNLEANLMRKKFRHSNNNNNNNNSGDEKSMILRSGGADDTATAASSGDVVVDLRRFKSESKTEAKYACPICDTVSGSQHEFTEHIRSHNMGADAEAQHFTCKICFKVLSSASSLDRHILVHTGERPFNCKYCHVTFTTNGNMHRHIRTHKQRGDTINGAPGITGSNHTADTHYDSDGVSSDSTSSSATNNNYTMTAEGKRKMTFDDSDSATQKRKQRNQNHINNNNIIEPPTSAIPPQNHRFCCPACGRQDFVSMVHLEGHMDREHPSIQAKCRFCEQVFKSHKALNGHKCSINTNRSDVRQGFNDMTFVDFSSDKFPHIARSLCEQSLRMSVSHQKFDCPQCGRAFPCASSVSIHARDCTGRPSDRSLELHPSRRRMYSETSEEDAKREDFFAHLDLQNTSATSANTFSSPSLMETSFAYSDKSYSDAPSNVKQEPLTPKSHHKSSGPYDTKDLADIQSIINATASGGGFMRQQLMDPTISMPLTPKEPNLPREEAEEDQDAFTSEFRKMKLRGEFPCKLCSAVFPNLRALKGHNRMHVSEAGAGPYRCNMCPFLTIDKPALIRHMRSHNGDRPYECCICNYAFTTKANCERHLRNRHGKSTRDEVKRSIIYHPSEDSSCDDPVKKMQIYNSSYDYDDSSPKERCISPVPHPKEMLTPPSEKSVKIQVKSMDQLIRPIAFVKPDVAAIINELPRPAVNRVVDLSMNVLDLSSKKIPEAPHSVCKVPEKEEEIDDDEEEEEIHPPPPMPNIDMAMFEKNQQMLIAQQQFLSETLPKIDPTHYFQLSQLYRNFMFPTAGFPLHPMFLQNSFLPPPGAPSLPHPNESHANEATRPPPMFPPNLLMGSLPTGPPPAPPTATPNQHPSSLMRRDDSPHRPPSSSHRDHSAHLLQPSHHPHHQPNLRSPEPQHNHNHMQHMQHSPASTQSSNTATNNNLSGPVKMVIKNGVLMPKQKQRRYRTERPFACEHCSARFTLRSNMERHIKQQHPQYWAQRQRGGGGHMMRRASSGSGAGRMASPGSAQSIPSNLMPNQLSAISDQVKYAILSQQLKSRVGKTDLDFFGGNPNHNNNNTDINNHMHSQFYQHQMQLRDQELQQFGDQMDVEDEEEEEEEEDDDDDNESELVIDEDSEPEDLSNKSPEPVKMKNEEAKKVAETILEQASRVAKPAVHVEAEKEIAEVAPVKVVPVVPEVKAVVPDEADLVSVSKLVDNATNATTPFGGYFGRDGIHVELSDEEGLVASGSASDNNSGAEDPNPSAGKKKSAYSMAPNRVSCPYCQRMFPWTSSLRRHILTHTGQKPFKCSHCPLLFTTKSNCDRHLLRKHGNVESAVSLYVPLEDVPEPMTARMDEPEEDDNDEPEERPLSVTPEPIETAAVVTSTPEPAALPKAPTPKPSADAPANPCSELPFKCHLCDASFGDRITCLEHIKHLHASEFALLMSKGAIETDVSSDHHQASAEDDDAKPESRGKYPDYANRKVMCAFCMRRFWSTEDLRRHMRTHSGERPFQCTICQRKFTLKHSMLRHQKKHAHHAHLNASDRTASGAANNSASDMSDDEQSAPPAAPTNESAAAAAAAAQAAKMLKIPDLIPKELSWKLQLEHKESLAARFFRSAHGDRDAGAAMGRDETSDLIGNLLGISDHVILSQVLRSSADEAAKLLGVQK